MPSPGPAGGDTIPFSTTGSAVTSSRVPAAPERADALLDHRVRQVHREVRRGRVDDRARAVVRRDRALEGLGERGDLARLGDARRPSRRRRSRSGRRRGRSGRGTRGGRSASRRRRSARASRAAPRRARRGSRRAPDPRSRRGRTRRARAAIRHAAGTSQSECSSAITSIAGPTAARIFRNGSSARSRSALEMSWPRLASAYGIERPDLHPGDALEEQVAGQLVGVVEERIEVLVRPLVPAEAPVHHGLAALVADVAVARARVVRADRVAARRRRGPGGAAGPAAWPARSQRAMSIAEAARISAPLAAVPT